jgi:hypothetical protein
MCERRYLVGEQWYNLKPNVLAEYRVGLQQVSFWLEWDRGAMNVRDLAVKFTSYAHYIARLFHSQAPDAPEYLTYAAQVV